MIPSNHQKSARCLLISTPGTWTQNWPGSQLFSAVGGEWVGNQLPAGWPGLRCIYATTSAIPMSTCIYPILFHDMEVIPGCYWAIRPQVMTVWNWNKYFVWCPSFSFDIWCSKNYFASSIHHCCDLESAPQAKSHRVRGLLKVQHRDLWQAQLSSFYYKNLHLFQGYSWGSERGKKNLTPMGSQIQLQPSHVRLAHKFTTTQLHWSLLKLAELQEGPIWPCCLCSVEQAYWKVCIPASVSADRRLSWQKRPKVWQAAGSLFTCTHSLVLPLPFHLLLDLSSLNFGQISSIISTKKFCFVFYTISSAAASL